MRMRPSGVEDRVEEEVPVVLIRSRARAAGRIARAAGSRRTLASRPRCTVARHRSEPHRAQPSGRAGALLMSSGVRAPSWTWYFGQDRLVRPVGDHRQERRPDRVTQTGRRPSATLIPSTSAGAIVRDPDSSNWSGCCDRVVGGRPACRRSRCRPGRLSRASRASRVLLELLSCRSSAWPASVQACGRPLPL